MEVKIKRHMERTLLYYPTIDIPNKEWLGSALLYSDKVASIVPFGSVNDPKFPSTLKGLMDQGQYKPIFIQELLGRYNANFAEFEKYFITTASSEKFCTQNQRKNEIVGSHYEALYNQKLTYNIESYLRERGLIRSNENGMIVTDEMVALLYMGVLAQYVAKVEDRDLIIPSTDDKRYEDIAFGMAVYKTPAFSLLLDNCLPNPIAGTSLKKIVKFKKERKAELIELRKFISKVQNKISNATSIEEVKEIQVGASEAMQKGILDLQKVYKDSNIKTFFSSFESLCKLESPKLFQLLVASGVITAPLHPIVGGAVGLIGVAGGMVSSYVASERQIESSEFSYLFRAQQSGIFHQNE